MLKKLTPHIVACLTFIAVAALYFAPQYEGKDVRQTDDIQATGMRGGITEHVEKYGEHPGWAPNMFSGMPAYLIHMNYEGRLLKEASSGFYFLGRPAAYYFILMAGFYFMLICFGVNPWLSIAGGLLYGLSTYFFIIYEAGHITKLMALSFIAPMIGAVFLAYTKRLWVGAALAGIFASIEISTSHPQITYYFLFVIVAIFISQLYEFGKQKKIADFIKRSSVLLVVAALAVGSNIVQLWYISDYQKDSTRSRTELTPTEEQRDNITSGLDRDYITAWSYGKMETFNLYIPNLMGGSSGGGFKENGGVAKSLKPYNAAQIAPQLPAYWGPQPFTSGPVYIGAVAVFLFILGIFLLRGAERTWILSVTALCILLSWGKHFMVFTNLFIDYLPGYNKLRVVSMILVIAEWSVPLLGMLALKKIWERSTDISAVTKALKGATITSAAIILFFIVFGSWVLDFTSTADTSMGLPEDVISAMMSERESLMRMDALRSFLFSVATAALVWAFAKEKLKKSHFVIILSALILADMIPVNKRFLNNDDFVKTTHAKAITPTKADTEILKDGSLSYRVANLSTNPFVDATTSYFHKSIGGYHAAKMRRYQEVIDAYLSKMDMDVYNMLNTKYFIQKADEGVEPTVALNPDALGNGWFVENVELVKSVDDEFKLLGDINTSNTAVVNDKFASALSGVALQNNADSLSSITLTESRANFLSYKTESTKEAVAVFSEIYYPKGWSAYIDGKEVEIICADYILRALVIPAGEHNVEFKFEVPHFKTLVGITYFSSIALIIILIGSIYIEYRKKNGSV